jgi:hypothetical protein
MRARQTSGRQAANGAGSFLSASDQRIEFNVRSRTSTAMSAAASAVIGESGALHPRPRFDAFRPRRVHYAGALSCIRPYGFAGSRAGCPRLIAWHYRTGHERHRAGVSEDGDHRGGQGRARRAAGPQRQLRAGDGAQRAAPLDGLTGNVLSLDAKGMTPGDIQAYLGEIYDTEISRDTISRTTDAVVEDLIAWQNRPLDSKRCTRDSDRRQCGQDP